uniref:5-azacytidine-induced protein 1 n=1 Tax=Glossina austeni TaxID=7395 RepID=A0A1A9UD99_GLOAU
MDLSLRGSQINLAARQKAKTKGKCTSLTNLFRTDKHGESRPKSANIYEKSNRIILCTARPQSADPKLGRNFTGRSSTQTSDQSIFNLGKNNKKHLGSSSSLLKFLLKEPIKRPWLCRDTVVNRELDNSSLLSPWIVGDELCESAKYMNTSSKSSEKFSMTDKNYKPISISPVNTKARFYICKQNLKSSTSADLLESISISRVQYQENCDRNQFSGTASNLGKSKQEKDIYSTTHSTFEAVQNHNLATSNFKKSVRFGAHQNSEEIVAETYEYPKCPSEHCSCSTPSSSSSSQQGASPQCICNLTSFKYASKTNKHIPSNLLTGKTFDKEGEIHVVKDYKNTVGHKLEGTLLEDLWEDKNLKIIDCQKLEIPLYLSKYSDFNTTLEKPQKPNNLVEVGPLHETYVLKMDNNLNSIDVSNNSNNHLKVVASTSSIIKKKENNKTPSVATGKVANVRSPRSEGDRSRDIQNVENEDSNLLEFNIDKVDTWMSSYESSPQKLSLNTSMLDESFQKLTKETLEAMKTLDPDLENGPSAKEEDGKHSSSSHDNSQDDSTYDEIVSVIKEIEDDKKKDEIYDNSQTPDNKLQDILSYLDNVEDNCDKTLLETRLAIPTNLSEVGFVVEPDIVEDLPKLSDLLMLPNHQLARKIVALSLRANELANALLLSKEHVAKIRTEKQKILRSEKSNAALRMREQKKHYETIVCRHQGFIEQLLKDKGCLCEKVAALTRRLESQTQAWEHKLETEIARVKENILASEKIRRERWVKENTKKIKELTVKGLEAEINKMSICHQKDLTELKSQHQQQLLTASEEARVKHEQIENSIRESCTQDRESVIAKERTVLRERFEKQIEEEREAFNKQKQKFIEDFHQEKEKLLKDLKTREEDMQSRKLEWQKEKEIELQRTTKEIQEKMLKQEEKYQNRLNTIEKQYEADFEVWKKEHENNCKMQQVEKENAIRQYYRAERDRQIDSIVQRMDAESLKNNEEFEVKTSRLKQKYEKDLQEAEVVEKTVREKYIITRNKLAESDAQLKNLQADIKRMKMELEHSKKMCKDFLNEREQLRENLKSELQGEMQGLKTEREQEIRQIHKRVQQAIEKKDVTIDILQKENGSLRERCLKLEAVIRQQRKDYCVK